MIAAILDAAGPDSAARRVERLARAVGGAPAARVQHGNAVLSAWAPATLDAGRGCACDVGGGAGIEIAGDALKLTRGACGGRSLYWARVRGAVWASSRLSPLVRALRDDEEGRPEVDTVLLAKAALAYSDGDSRTVHARVHRVTSRAVLTATPRAASAALAPIDLEPIEGDAAILADGLREAFFAAVARALDGHARVGVIVGGGLDSSAVLAAAVAIARSRGGPEIDALALDFVSDGDDRPHLRALASSLGITPIRVDPRACAPILRESLVADAAPNVWPTAAWELTLLKMARERGATAVLSGIGGDDVFDGDPRVLGWSVCRGDVGALVDAARLIVPWRSSAPHRIGEFVLRPIAARFVPSRMRRAMRVRRAARALPRWAGPAMRDAILGGPPAASARPSAWEPTATERYEALSGSAVMLDVADARGQAETAAGIVRLDPCLDPELVAFAARLPERAMLHGGRLRGLFREAMRGTLPESVRLRPDKAAFEPAFEAMLSALGGLGTFGNLATAEALGALGIVDPAMFRADFDEFVTSRRDDVLGIWPALAAEAFARDPYGKSSE